MRDFDVEVKGRREQYRGRGWAVSKDTCLHCGETAVNVYPAHLEQIECKCGRWIMTPLGERRASVSAN